MRAYIILWCIHAFYVLMLKEVNKTKKNENIFGRVNKNIYLCIVLKRKTLPTLLLTIKKQRFMNTNDINIVALEVIAEEIKNDNTSFEMKEFEYEGETYYIDLKASGRLVYDRDDRDGSLYLSANTVSCRDVKVMSYDEDTDTLVDITTICAKDVEDAVSEAA